ncbi:MAG: hypothetical protein LBC74_07680 [Planctomycetaceae bacterium]|jgi:hypothetical protein|nr:hypothetical protein [Planctomycetaceae bacterium]
MSKKRVRFFLVICTISIVALILLLISPTNEQLLEYDIQRKINRFVETSASISLDEDFVAEKISCELLLGNWQRKTYRDCITNITIECQPNDHNLFLLTIFIQNSVARYSAKRIAKINEATNSLVLETPIALGNSDAFIRLVVIRHKQKQQLFLMPIFKHSHPKIFFIKNNSE